MPLYWHTNQLQKHLISLLKMSLIRGSTSVRAVWWFAGHRSQSARVPWWEEAGIGNPRCTSLGPWRTKGCTEAAWSSLPLHSPLVLWGFSFQDQLQCWSQSCAAVNKREQLGDIATGGPIALNIINSWSDIILILIFRVGCKLSLHLSPGLY